MILPRRLVAPGAALDALPPVHAVLVTPRGFGGFVLEAGGRTVMHAGDTACFAGFAEIGARFPRLAAHPDYCRFKSVAWRAARSPV